jgi:hypothetical protein
MNKKKIILGIAIGLVLVVVLAVVIVASKLDTIVETAIETVGPKLTKTSLQLEKVSIRPLSGGGSVNGLVLGTPEGYKAEYTIKMDKAELSISPGSLLSDKIVVKSIVVESPEIILEGGLKENNLTAIQNNVTAAVGAGGTTQAPATTEGDAAAQKKLQVDHFKFTGARVHLRLSMLAGKNVTITAPDVELTNLGTGPEGITSAELVKLAMTKLTGDILIAAAKSVGELGKEAANAAGKAASDAVGAAAKESGDAVNKASEGIKNLFNKKKE